MAEIVHGFPRSYFTPIYMEGQLTPTYSEEKGQPCRYDQVGRVPHLQSLFWVYVLFSVVFLFHAGQQNGANYQSTFFTPEKET